MIGKFKSVFGTGSRRWDLIAAPILENASYPQNTKTTTRRQKILRRQMLCPLRQVLSTSVSLRNFVSRPKETFFFQETKKSVLGVPLFFFQQTVMCNRTLENFILEDLEVLNPTCMY